MTDPIQGQLYTVMRSALRPEYPVPPGLPRPGVLWFSLAVVLLAMLALPCGFRIGLWNAPLESETALLALVAAWIACCHAALSDRRSPTRAEILLAGVLIATKLALWLILPSSGLWARTTPASGKSQLEAMHQKSGTPLRPVGQNGMALYRTPFAPPLFVNDFRYDTTYTPTQPDRSTYPVAIEARFWLLADSSLTLAVPPGSRLSGEAIVAHGPGPLYRVTGRPGLREVVIQTTSTGAANPPLLQVAEEGEGPRLRPLEAWRLWPGEKPGLTSAKARLAWLAGRGWNALFFALVALLWWNNALAGAASRPRTVLRAGLAGGFLAVAALMPVTRHGLDWVTAGWLLPVTAALLFGIWHALRGSSQDIPFLNGALLLAWTLFGCRLFLDRYPGGHLVLTGGFDSFFHYSFAMDILNGDWLQLADAPFTRQALTRYLLAGIILLCGEAPAWGLIVNWTLAGVLGLVLAAIVRPFGANRAALLGLIWYPFLLVSPFRTWIPTLMPEVSSLVFLFAAVLALNTSQRTPDPRAAWRGVVAAGLLLGLAIWARNNLLLVAPFWALALILPLRDLPTRPSDHRQRWRTAALLLAVVATMVLAVTVRNRLLAPEGPVALLMRPDRSAQDLFQGFPLPNPEAKAAEGLPPERRPSFSRIFFEAVRRDPALFAQYQIERLSVLLGGPALREPNLVANYPRVNPLNLLLWGLLAARLLARFRSTIMGFPQLLCWGIMLSQAGLLVFTGFVGPGYRFVLPFYPCLLLLIFLPGGIRQAPPST